MSTEPDRGVGEKCSESEECSGGRDCQITGSSCQALKSALYKLNRLDDFHCESIGTGFFSEVFKVTHKVTGQVMVLKKNLLRSNRPNMLKEVQLMNQLSHPNILGFMGVCVHEGQLHALTEYIDRGKLEQIIQDRSIPLSYSVRIKLALDIAKGMEYLHSQEIFHRDLTSKNVFVKTEDNGEMKAVVGDFGLATKIPKVGDRLGTVGSAYWMSPECLKGEWYGPMSDVFSYGIILCEMIARVEADPDILPRTENFGLDYIAFTSLCGDPPPPPPFLKLAFTCCNYDPSNRPSFSEIVQNLEDLICSGKEESKTGEIGKDISQHTKLSHRRSFSDDGIRILGETMALQDVFYKPSQQNPFNNIPAYKGRKQVLNHSSSEVDSSYESTVVAEPVVKPSKILQTLKQQEMQRKVSSLMDAICAGRCFTAETPHSSDRERDERGRLKMRRAMAAMPPSLPSSPTFTRRAASTPKSHPPTAKLRTCSSGSNLAALEDHVTVLRRRCSCESGFFSSVGEDFCLPECAASSVTLSSGSAASSLLLDSNPYGDSSCEGLLRHLPRRHTKRASSVYTDSSEDISINTIDSDHQDERKMHGAEPQQIHKMVEYFESKQSSQPSAFYRQLRSNYENRHRRAPMHRLLVCEGAVSSKLQLFDKK